VLKEEHDAAGVQRWHKMFNDYGRIGLVHQNPPSDDGVEPSVFRRQRGEIGLSKRGVCQA
jgi:hypothetical protein